jgi:hypothetical protein
MLLDRVRKLHRNKPLAGRRIAVLATDGFEMVKLAVPAAAMRLAGATVDVISIRSGRIRGMNLHEPARTVRVDLTLDQANPADYDGLSAWHSPWWHSFTSAQNNSASSGRWQCPLVKPCSRRGDKTQS